MSQVPFQLDVGMITIPLFIGTVLNWSLLGALAVQVYLYLLAFPKDRPINRLVVAFIFIAEILQTMGDTRNTFETFGSGWGDLESLDEVLWAWFSVPILGSTIACVGQLFFAWRISIIGNTWYIPCLIAVITAFQWGGGIWTGVDIVRAGRFSLLAADHLRPPIAWLSATAAADLIIVAATLYYIMKAQDPEFKVYSANRVAVSRIIRVSVETGVLCAVFAIVDLSLFVKFGGNNVHLAVCIWLSKVYSNSIMVILNSRAYIGHAAPPDDSPPRMSQMMFQSINIPASAVHISMAMRNSSSDLSTDSSHTHHEQDPITLDKQRGELAV